eukprot:scaffold211_cov83-Skeletonema_dohrnii-CCMP3373.AAC.2
MRQWHGSDKLQSWQASNKRAGLRSLCKLACGLSFSVSHSCKSESIRERLIIYVPHICAGAGAFFGL